MLIWVEKMTPRLFVISLISFSLPGYGDWLLVCGMRWERDNKVYDPPVFTSSLSGAECGALAPGSDYHQVN